MSGESSYTTANTFQYGDLIVWSMTLVTAGNNPPILAAIGPQSVRELQNLNFGVSAGDVESTPVLTTSSLPSGATFLDNGDGTGTFDWTPSIGQANNYNVTFYATDDSLAVDSEIVAISVTSFNAVSVSRVGAWTTGLTHTVGAGSDRLLIFAVGYENATDVGVSSVTYGGQSLTQIIGSVAGTTLFARSSAR